MTGKPNAISEQEVLLAFAVEPVHDRKTLERYLAEYPQHADALVDCSSELMLDSMRSDDASPVSDEVIDRAWRQFEVAVGQPVVRPTANPFAALKRNDFKEVAKNLNISNLLLMRFRDRAIDFATIPRSFVQRIAAELGASPVTLSAYLRNPPGMVSSQSFRSSVKPTVAEQMSFERAIATSQLTPEQQEALKALQD